MTTDFDQEAGRTPAEEAASWGPVSTVVIALVLTLMPGVLVGVAAALVVGAEVGSADPERLAVRMEETLSDGDFSGLAIWAGALLGVPLLLVAVRVRGWERRGRMFPFRAVSGRALAGWVAAGAAALVGCDAALRALGRTTTPEVWWSAFATLDHELLLWSAAVLAAPLFEELVFRGFVFDGLSRSRLGAAGSVVVASFVWALEHFDYGVDHLFVVFSLGLLLGAARVRTGSLWTPIIVHALWNVAAVVAAELQVSGLSTS